MNNQGVAPHRADGPAATDQIEVVVPDSLPVSGLVGSSHAVSLGAAQEGEVEVQDVSTWIHPPLIQ